MSFPLVEFIYDNLDDLYQLQVISDVPHCGPNAREYLELKHKGAESILDDISMSLEHEACHLNHVECKKMDELFKANEVLQTLISDIESDRDEDGCYYVIISDGKRSSDEDSTKHLRSGGVNLDLIMKDVAGHVFLIEKSGDRYCLIQTHYLIGNRKVCGLPLCGINRNNLLMRLTNITDMLTPTEEENDDMIHWTRVEWSNYLGNLGFELQPDLPKFSDIVHRRCLWIFIQSSEEGSLYGIKNVIEEKLKRSKDFKDERVAIRLLDRIGQYDSELYSKVDDDVVINLRRYLNDNFKQFDEPVEQIDDSKLKEIDPRYKSDKKITFSEFEEMYGMFFDKEVKTIDDRLLTSVIGLTTALY